MSVTKSNSAADAKKLPRQERSRRTYQMILESAASVIRTEGIEKLSTNRVAAVANVSIGSLYQYFPSKVAIVAALIEQAQARELEEVKAFLNELGAEATPLQVAARIFSHYYRLKDSDLILRKTLIDLTPSSDRAAHAMRFHHAMAELIIGFFQERFHLSAQDFDKKVFVLKYILKGLTLSSIDSQIDHLGREHLTSKWAPNLLTLLNIHESEFNSFRQQPND